MGRGGETWRAEGVVEEGAMERGGGEGGIVEGVRGEGRRGTEEGWAKNVRGLSYDVCWNMALGEGKFLLLG